MTIEIRRGNKRGHGKYDWLETFHSFSFSDYYDSAHMQHGPLRVLNEDFVKPGAGFNPHPHQDMEVVSYVLSGRLAHKDSTGGKAVINAGEVQRMTAGTGIVHSEYNDSDTDIVHFLQVWFLPAKKGLKPGYEQRQLGGNAKNKLLPVVYNHEGDDNLFINQDVTYYICDLMAGKSVDTTIKEGRLGYLHNAMFGKLKLNCIDLSPGDGLKIIGPEYLTIKAVSDSHFVLFDMGNL